MANKQKSYALFYLITNYRKEKIFSFFYFFIPLITSLFAVCLKNIIKINLNFNILYLIDFIQASFPTLIGFVIAGYAILTTFSNDKYLSKIVEFEKISHDNYYLQISAIFGWSALVQAVGIILSIFIKILYPLKDKIVNIFVGSYTILIKDIIKNSVEFIFLFIITYSFFQLIAIVLNLFMWTKSFHDYLKSAK